MSRSLAGKLTVASVAALAGGTVGWVPAADAKPVAVLTVVTCGQVITSSITVANDIGPCLGDGLIVQGSNARINLGGHTVLGAAENPASVIDQAGIRLDNVSGTTIRNGTVRGFFVGVLVKGASGNVVTNMTVDHNIGLGTTLYNDGIVLDGSTGNLVRANTVTSNGPDAGIAMVNGASYNRIAANYVADNNIPYKGVGQGGTDIVYDTGISNDTASNYNVISNNQVLRNGFFGIALSGQLTSHDQAIGNTVRDNGILGINAGGNGHLVSRNIIDHNGYQAGGPQSIGFSGGVGTCGQVRFPPCGPDPTVIESNRVTDNFGFGIGLLYNGTQSLGGTNKSGVVVAPAPYAAPRSNLVQRNKVFGNSGDGIYVECDMVYDADGSGSCITDSPPHVGQRILQNVARNNGGAGAGTTAWDLHDANPGCDHDVWSQNVAITAEPPCTLSK